MVKENNSNILLVILALMVIILAFGMWKYSSDNTNDEKLDINGFGKVVKTPDQAVLYIYAETKSETVVTSQSDNAAIINGVISALKQNGVSETDIETYSYSITPEYVYPDKEDPRITGYKTIHGLKVKTSKVSETGKLLEVSAKAGANRFDNIDFTLTDAKAEEAKKEAISIATANAIQKAEVLAESSEVKLKKVISISATTTEVSPYRFDIAKGVANGVTIPSKNIEITASVQITYEI